MREIKFRAWDTVLGKMVTPTEIALRESGVTYLDCDTGDGSHGEIGRYVLEQYTGLKDRNGVEIYEGDIVRVREKSLWGGEYLAKVEWLSDWAIYGFNCFHVVPVKDSDIEDKTRCYGFIFRHFGNCVDLSEALKFEECAVIGNVHQNPELLTQTK